MHLMKKLSPDDLSTIVIGHLPAVLKMLNTDLHGHNPSSCGTEELYAGVVVEFIAVLIQNKNPLI